MGLEGEARQQLVGQGEIGVGFLGCYERTWVWAWLIWREIAHEGDAGRTK
jgi:hypothetical protein